MLGFEQLMLKFFSFTKKVFVNAYHTTHELGVSKDLETRSMRAMIAVEMVV